MDHDETSWRRAGAALRGRAAEQSRSGPGPDGVERLAGRRRVLQGSLATVAVLAIGGLVVTNLGTVPNPTIDPVAPSDVQPSETPTPPAEDAASTDGTGLAMLPACDEEDTASQVSVAATTGASAAAPPAAVAGSPLVSLGDHALALTADGRPSAAIFGHDDGWRCLPAPDLEEPRLTIGGRDRALVVGTDGAALLDLARERWTDLPAPDGTRPVAGVWTGRDFVLVLEARAADDPSAVVSLDPATGEWSELALAPFGVNAGYHTSVLWDGDRVLLLGNWLDSSNHAASEAAMIAGYAPDEDEWEWLPDSPLSPQATRAAMAEDRLLAVDYTQAFAEFDLGEQVWDVPASSTGLTGSECPPEIAATDAQVLVTACWAGAILDRDTGTWSAIQTDGSFRAPVALDDGRIVHWHVASDGGAELLVYEADAGATAAAAVEVCADVADFGARLADTGMTPDESAPASPTDLADDVDLVVAGTLTGEVEAANGPGPAGESYVAYGLEVTEVLQGDAAVGDTLLVSLAFDGTPVRGDGLRTDVPVGADVVVFAYRVTDAPGGLVAADGGGFTTACPGGPPLGADVAADGWDALGSLDDLAAAVRDR